MKLEDLTVLYAEDEEGIQETVSDVLELYVNNVITASNGEEVIDFYNLYKPSILLLDICMPLKDGLSALKQIRENDIHTPVIIMTAHTEKKYLIDAVELHITKYLIKPFDKNTLVDALNDCIKLLSSKNNAIITLNDEITFDYKKQIIIKNKEEVPLNKKERLLLNLFINNKNQILSYEQIEYHIWNDTTSQEALKSLIKDLRKKTSKELIQNISKIGYKFKTHNA